LPEAVGPIKNKAGGNELETLLIVSFIGIKPII
jgi:hypothetical protein